MNLIQIENQIHSLILNEHLVNIFANYGDNSLLLFQPQQGIHPNGINKATQPNGNSSFVVFNQSRHQCHKRLIEHKRSFILGLRLEDC